MWPHSKHRRSSELLLLSLVSVFILAEEETATGLEDGLTVCNALGGEKVPECVL